MDLILDLDLDVFVNPVANWRNEDDPRLDEEEYAVDDEEKVIEYVTKNLKLDESPQGIALEHHVQVLAEVERAISHGIITPPFKWVHIDAHDDLCGHWKTFNPAKPNSGNFLYKLFFDGYIKEFVYVYRHKQCNFPDYMVSPDYSHITIQEKDYPIEWSNLYLYEMEKKPDYVFFARSPAFTPRSADKLFDIIKGMIKPFPFQG